MSDQSPDRAAADPAAAGPPDVPPTAEDALTEEEVEAAPADADDAAEGTPGVDVDSAEEALVKDAPDYKDLYLRGAADMDNLRKRSRRDVGAAESRGIAKLAKELLPAIDNLERALQAAEAAEGQGEHDITKGIRLVQAEFVGALTRSGISIEDPKGQPFDPHRHEALAQAPVEGTDPGVVVEVYQPGYVLGDSVLRAARVVVSG